ncbi:MAG: CPBP family intramembrane metalloprotease [Candidatus Hydrogenedentes bacterium]|nr:CPBP family intramembrane metalloprotease [Candidatus Hydrogenedentota bacterium]
MEESLTPNARGIAHLRKPALFFLAFYAAWTLRVVLLLPHEGAIQPEIVKRVYLDTLRILLWIVPLWVYLIRVERVSPIASLGLNTFPMGRRALESVAIAGVFFAVLVTVAITLEHKVTIFQKDVPLGRWPMIFFGMWAAPVIEEIFFRGFVYRRLREVFRFQTANGINALLFVSIHIPGWLYLQGLNTGMAANAVGVLIIGWVLGLLMERAQSVWPPILAHFFNNLLWSG